MTEQKSKPKVTDAQLVPTMAVIDGMRSSNSKDTAYMNKSADTLPENRNDSRGYMTTAQFTDDSANRMTYRQNADQLEARRELRKSK